MKLSCLNRYLVFVSSLITLSTFSSVIYANGDYLIRQGLQELVQRANFDKAEEFITRASKEHPNFKLAKFLEAELYTAMLGKEVAVREKSIAVDADSLSYDLLEEAKLRSSAPSNLAQLRPLQILKMPPNMDFMILVDASLHRAYVLKNQNGEPVWVHDFFITLGKLGIGKQKEGDQKTPLGLYQVGDEVSKKNLTPFYGVGALRLNFPNSFDKHAERSGSGIWLHGVPQTTYNRPPKASDGCIVFANDDLKQLIRIAQGANINVLVSTSVKWLPRTDWQNRYKKVMDDMSDYLTMNPIIKNNKVLKKDLIAVYAPESETSVIVDRGLNNMKNYQRFREYWEKKGTAWQLKFESEFKS